MDDVNVRIRVFFAERAGEFDEMPLRPWVRDRNHDPVGVLLAALGVAASIQQRDVRTPDESTEEPLTERKPALDALEACLLEPLFRRLEVVDDGDEENPADGVAEQNGEDEPDHTTYKRGLAEEDEVHEFGKGDDDVEQVRKRDHEEGDVDEEEPRDGVVGGEIQPDDAGDDEPGEPGFEEQVPKSRLDSLL